jgi:hypothetical protein
MVLKANVVRRFMVFPPTGNDAQRKRAVKAMRELIAPTNEVLQFSDSAAEGQNAAFYQLGHAFE